MAKAPKKEEWPPLEHGPNDQGPSEEPEAPTHFIGRRKTNEDGTPLPDKRLNR